MADRSIKVIIGANVSGLTAGLRTAQTQLTDFGSKVQKSALDNRAAWEQTGSALTTAGAALTVVAAGAVKAAIDWESAWAGVTKTIDATPAQLADIEDGLRGLATELPATHDEIAGVAEAAGQLGVASEDVVGFTETMINLGETTNLTAEDAATNIAQISNVMGTLEREGAVGVERFGAALVELGNNGASTEAEILSMAQRIAGAGATVGATETDVLALANTLASMGVNAELGGGVATRILLKMRTAADEGGESLEAFASVAGLSASEFAEAFRSSPVDALGLVAAGINDVNTAGGNVTATLKDMGIKGTEETQVMLALANSGDLLTDSLEMGAAAWAENSALAEEAEKRYETTAAQMQIAWNAITDAAITVGEVALPVLAELADGIADVAEWFGGLPEPVQKSIGALTGIIGIASLAAGGFLMLAPRVFDTISAFKDLRTSAPLVSSALGKVGKAAGVAAGAFIAAQAAAAAFGKELPDDGASAWTNRLLDVSSAADLAAFSLEGTDYATFNLAEAFERLNDPGAFSRFEDFSGNLVSMNSDADLLSAEFESMGQALATVFASDPDVAAEKFDLILQSTGATTEELLGLMPAYRDVLDDASASQKLAGDSAGEMEAATEGSTSAIEAQAEALKEQQDALIESANLMLGARGAARNLEAAIDGATEAIEKNGKGLDLNTEAGRENEAALDEIASAGWSLIEQQIEQGATEEELRGSMRKTRRAFIDAAVAAGMERDEAKALADELGLIPKDIETEIKVDAGNSVSTIRTVADGINGLNDKTITVTTRRRTEVFTPNRDVTRDHTPFAAGGLVGFASGGMVPGTPPADPMADNVPAMNPGTGSLYAIRSGEFIQSQPAVDHYGVAAMAAINSRRVPKNLLTGFAAGGQVPGYAGSSQAGASASVGTVTATLAPEDRALLRAVIDRPVRLDVDGRKFAEVSRSTQRRFDAR